MQLSGSQLSRRVAALVDFTGAARPIQATERATIANFLSCTLAGDFDTRTACSVLGCFWAGPCRGRSDSSQMLLNRASCGEIRFFLFRKVKGKGGKDEGAFYVFCA
jgi:hypothetical protein